MTTMFAIAKICPNVQRAPSAARPFTTTISSTVQTTYAQNITLWSWDILLIHRQTNSQSQPLYSIFPFNTCLALIYALFTHHILESNPICLEIVTYFSFRNVHNLINSPTTRSNAHTMSRTGNARGIPVFPRVLPTSSVFPKNSRLPMSWHGDFSSCILRTISQRR